MEPVTSPEGKKGFYDESTGFVPVDSMQKVTSPQGVKGYYHETAGFVPEPSANKTPPSKGFWGSMADSYSKRAENIAQMGPTNPLAIGQGAGFIQDVAGAGIKSLYSNLMPEAAQEGISSFLKPGIKNITESPLGQLAGKGLKYAGEAYGGFKEKHPELALDIESAGNILGMLPMGKGAKEGLNIVRDVKGLTSPLAKSSLDSELSSTITRGIEKSIRPSVVKQQTAGQTAKYFSRAKSAVEDIVSNKENLSFVGDTGEAIKGRLPQSLKEFSQSIEQTKGNIFQKYNQMAVGSGKEGIAVDLDPIAKELTAVAKDPVLQDLSPGAVKHAQERALAFGERGKYTAEQAQDAIKVLNQSLEAFYKNPTPDMAHNVYIDSLIVNNLRKSLDQAVEKVSGPGYQELKNSYGSLKEIEKDVSKRAGVDARRNIKGLLDFSDIFSGYEVIKGILTLNPSTIAAGAGARGIAALYRHINNPNRIVRNLFGDAEKLINKREMAGRPFEAQSMAGRGIQNLLRKKEVPPPELQGIPMTTYPNSLDTGYTPKSRTTTGTIDMPSGLTMERDFENMLANQRAKFGTPIGPGTSPSSVVPKKAIPYKGTVADLPTPIRSKQEMANFYKGTIPITSYAPGTPDPMTKTYWVSEEAREKAAKEARKKWKEIGSE